MRDLDAHKLVKKDAASLRFQFSMVKFKCSSITKGWCQLNFVVHIGDGKAGSSAIQHALSRKENELREKNIICDGVLHGHYSLPTLIGRRYRSDDARSLDRAHDTVEALRKACKAKPDATVIISAESFMNLATQDVVGLLQLISDEISSLKIVAYVRSPAEHYLSKVQQELKGDSAFTPPDRYVRRLDLIVDRWIRDERCSEVVVRPFRRDLLADGSVVRDFEDVLEQLTSKKLELEDASENSTISAEQMIVLQRFRDYGGFQNGKLHPASSALVSFFSRINREMLVGKKPKLTNAAKDAVIEGNKDVWARLTGMFPYLAPLVEVAVSRTKNRQWVQSDSVSSILAEFDESDVKFFSRLIPFQESGKKRNISVDDITSLKYLGEKYSVNEDMLITEYLHYAQTTPELIKSSDALQRENKRLEQALDVERSSRKKYQAELAEERRRRVDVETRLKKAWRDPIPHLFLALQRKLRKGLQR